MNIDNIDMCFFAEDSTVLGNAYLDEEGNLKGLLPCFNKDILCLFKKCREVKYFIFGFYNTKEYDLVIFENSIQVIEKLLEDFKEITEESFLKMQPQTTGFAQIIMKEELEKLEGENNIYN